MKTDFLMQVTESFEAGVLKAVDEPVVFPEILL